MKCKVKGCSNKYFSNDYCSKHYQQVKKHGKIFKRTKYDRNEVRFSKYYVGIFLYNKAGKKISYTIIDKEDYKRVKNYKWYSDLKQNDCTYVACHINSKKVYIHNILLNLILVDHINGNTLDNRKENLRKCSHTENSRNAKLSKNNTSGFKGVYWSKDKQKWHVRICINYKSKHLGYFTSLKKAAKAYNKGALKYFGEFARLNII